MLHPLIVHFPIALLIVGACAALASKLFCKSCLHENLRLFAAYSIILGAVSAVVAVLSGFLFTQEMVGRMGEIRNTHMLFAFVSVVCGGVSALLMFFTLLPKYKHRPLLQTLALASALITAAAIALTGHYGGMMVFGL